FVWRSLSRAGAVSGSRASSANASRRPPDRRAVDSRPADAKLNPAIPARHLGISGHRDFLHHACPRHLFRPLTGTPEQAKVGDSGGSPPTLHRKVTVVRSQISSFMPNPVELTVELTPAQRAVEPRNADSHLAFIAAGLRTCVQYRNRTGDPVCFVDLDGVHQGRPRRRLTTIVGYTAEQEVTRARVTVPASAHPIDSINLKDQRLGVYEQLVGLINRHGVTQGRIRLELASAERHAGLTVNEYETLLMRH